MHRFRVGNVECAVVSDGQVTLPPERILPPSRRAEWPPVKIDAEGCVSVSLNCLLVWTAGKVLLVDTGNGNKPTNKWPGGGSLLEEMASAGVRPSDVDVVAFTHAAGDHVGWATCLDGGRLVPTFPRARYLLPREEWDFCAAPGQTRQQDVVRDGLMPLKERGQLDLAEDGAQIAPGVSYLLAPGHSPGHCVVLVESEGQTLMHVGDLVHNSWQFQYPDLVNDHDILPDLVPGSRERIARLALERSALVLPGHEPYPGLGRITAENGGFVFRPVG